MPDHVGPAHLWCGCPDLVDGPTPHLVDWSADYALRYARDLGIIDEAQLREMLGEDDDDE